MNNDNKLKGRDLINVGIYSAIYFVIMMAVAMLGMIPIFLPLLSVIVPILGGIPFMLFLTKVRKPGMILIMAMIMGIMMLLTGMGPWPLLTCAIAGILSELTVRSGKYLFDEPTSGLDYAHMEETARLMKDLRNRGTTILVVTHDSELIHSCCGRVITL